MSVEEPRHVFERSGMLRIFQSDTRDQLLSAPDMK